MEPPPAQAPRADRVCSRKRGRPNRRGAIGGWEGASSPDAPAPGSPGAAMRRLSPLWKACGGLRALPRKCSAGRTVPPQIWLHLSAC